MTAGRNPGRRVPASPIGCITISTPTSHRLYGARAGMVDALILGRRGGIDPDLQQRFARGAGSLLSISGFHVGLITAWMFLFGRLARLAGGTALASRRGNQRRLRGLPRVAGPGDAGGGARGAAGALPHPSAARPAQCVAGGHLSRRCCWSIPGPLSTSAAGSPRRRSGAPPGSPGGRTARWAPASGPRTAASSARRDARHRAHHRGRPREPSRSPGCCSISWRFLWRPWRCPACSPA